MDNLKYEEFYNTSEYCSPHEFEELINLAIEYHESASDYFGSMNLKKMITGLAQAMSKHPVFVTRNDDGEIVGAIVLDDAAPWWGDEGHLTNLLIYVRKEYRAFGTTRNLITLARNYAKEIGKPLELMFFHPEDLERKLKLFNHMGLDTRAFIVGE